MGETDFDSSQGSWPGPEFAGTPRIVPWRGEVWFGILRRYRECQNDCWSCGSPCWQHTQEGRPEHAAHPQWMPRTCCSPTMLRLWPRRPSGQLVLQPAEITLLPLCTGSTKGVYFLGSQESENVAQNKVGVQLGQDVPAGTGKIPKSLCSYILSLSILLQ